MFRACLPQKQPILQVLWSVFRVKWAWWFCLLETWTICGLWNIPLHCHTRPSYNRPSYNRPSYNRPSYNRPSYNRPSYNRPSYNRPSYNRPSYNRPSYNRPSYNRPSYNRPSYNRPSYNRPSYNRPSYNRPSYNRPSYNIRDFPRMVLFQTGWRFMNHKSNPISSDQSIRVVATYCIIQRLLQLRLIFITL